MSLNLSPPDSGGCDLSLGFVLGLPPPTYRPAWAFRGRAPPHMLEGGLLMRGGAGVASLSPGNTHGPLSTYNQISTGQGMTIAYWHELSPRPHIQKIETKLMGGRGGRTGRGWGGGTEGPARGVGGEGHARRSTANNNRDTSISRNRNKAEGRRPHPSVSHKASQADASPPCPHKYARPRSKTERQFFEVRQKKTKKRQFVLFPTRHNKPKLPIAALSRCDPNASAGIG